MSDTAVQDDPKPIKMHAWRSSSASRPKLPKDQAARQGVITNLAFQLLGGRDAALDFLNSQNPVLGGRPLDLAVASKDGFTAVEQVIRRLAVAP